MNSTPQTTLPADNGEHGKDLSLIDYLETQFIPANSQTKTKDYICSLRRAAHLFCAFIGNLPINEIDQESLDTYRERLIEAGYSKKTARGYHDRLKAVLRSMDPAAFPKRSKLPGALDWTDDRILAVVFQKQFMPQHLADRSDQTKRQYWAAIGLFDDFLGRPARLCDLTDESVDKLMSWLGDSHRSPATVTTILDHLLAIWRWCAKKRLIDCWPDEKPDGEPIAGLLSKLLGRTGLGGNGKQTPPPIKSAKGGTL